MNEEPKDDMEIESWQIMDFNLQGRSIKIGKLGLVKIIRCDDGTLVLVGDYAHRLIDQEKPTAAHFSRNDSILGFVLDIGIQKEKWLSGGHGFYFGMPLIQRQSQRPVSQTDFDENLFEKIGTVIDKNFQSGDSKKETEAIRLQLLFDAYNNARLLFPNFCADSYLGLMRILDAVGSVKGACDFGSFVASVSSSLNKDIYSKIQAIKSYDSRIKIAADLFDVCVAEADKKKWSCSEQMEKFDDSGKVVFSCFYSAYQYRNKFVHLGFPFPDIVKDAHGLKEGSGTAYLNPALGISWQKIHRPEGLKDGDLIDIHQIVQDENEAQEFKEKYFQLLPTWHFLKCYVREALISKISD
ncbi:MAG: hypothetical protein A2W52_02125 [Candidatus Taylorbacteria bacterium RIFCSPHIGHO2_02_49_25]|uniref:Uncharacterized protein n=1 Tax=Candidatus Taylorbacteria bacterium RIFCSPHIGHO2_02_49_25 TaxID=1802305 RepID=A0A1G2MEZ8_9BACT|nr:MAG: hypothetical protein UY62_C0021G0024 [Parcubacteria group bacterium GW2011_GWF2_50_9]OHA19939.1 MAG: hypothetical protein A2759_04160 [Candidatus Taylorbacteria bacterium RIFCSPHIGHO2_01_FULL_49_60]OHA21739.1 MAG: hypothetical protein A2W52_02125 [Candidatus Taylorbacteria bacterium RIFCSPHIGHO2_02_49_25]OHA35441.1 MAG: hypothetical protein A2W65_00260 [Candidatus Taylorbacteria bacterium RIFCSPLOWO2_02_50_13]OHA45858.1 MAG: hypothetical protein A3G61_03615 [Candidatus Taylorbacteria ba